MKILLTGGSGFLGSAIALELLKTDHKGFLLLRPTSRLERLQGNEAGFVIGRCVSDDEIEAFICDAQPDAIIHTACSYGRLNETFTQIADANVRFGLVILQAVLRGDRPVTFINTGTVLDPDVSLYALTKHQFSQYGRFLASQDHLKLRFVNVLLQHMYGPGDDPSKFTSHVLTSCQRNEPSLKLTAGEQRRDFIYIDDVVSAYTTLLQKKDELELIADIDVGSGIAPTIREFVEMAQRLTASRTELAFGALPYRPHETMYCQADITRMRKLGWEPAYDLESGLKKTIRVEYSK